MNKLESLSRTSITFSAPASRPHSNQNDRKPRQNGEKNSRELLERSVPVGALNETLSRANIIDRLSRKFSSQQQTQEVEQVLPTGQEIVDVSGSAINVANGRRQMAEISHALRVRLDDLAR